VTAVSIATAATTDMAIAPVGSLARAEQMLAKTALQTIVKLHRPAAQVRALPWAYGGRMSTAHHQQTE
jgi:hypothetical protein